MTYYLSEKNVYRVSNMSRQNIAFWTNAVSHLHHEIKAVNIWLVFVRFK